MVGLASMMTMASVLQNGLFLVFTTVVPTWSSPVMLLGPAIMMRCAVRSFTLSVVHSFVLMTRPIPLLLIGPLENPS